MVVISILFLSAGLSYILAGNLPSTEKLLFTKSYIFPALLFLLAMALYHIDQENYKGSYLTYIGCFSSFIGLFSLSSEIEAYFTEHTLNLSSLVTLTIAAIFLYFGHRRHKTLTKPVKLAQ